MVMKDVSSPPLPPGAVLYTADTENRRVLTRFARELVDRGWSVGGVVQETLMEGDAKIGMDIVEVDTGRHIPLARPTPGQIADGTCALDRGALAESSEAIRRAVAANVDLVVIEKFAEQERNNRGLAEEILLSMSEGLSTLVSVPASLLEDWNRFSGGFGSLLPSDEQALWRWWGPHRLYRDLVLGVPDRPVRRVVAGSRMVLVEGPDGCGTAPISGLPGDDLDLPPGATLRDLAERLLSWERKEIAIGLAAVNAHYNRPDLADGPEAPPGIADEIDGPAVVVGHLPRLAARLGARKLARTDHGDDTFPPTAARWLLPRNEGVVIAASALLDKTLPTILESCRQAETALVGPSTPLSPRLHAYGLTRLAGMVITDADGASDVVANGGCGRDLSAFGKPAAVAAIKD